MRTGSSTLNYMLGDQLGSTAITTDSVGGKLAEIRYYPWGKKRYTSGETPTSYQFTGQRIENALGLYYYGARWSPGSAPGTGDPAAGRFIQPDTLIPSIGESSSKNGIGYVPSKNYSALVVDYHENQFLEQLNSENNLKLQNQKDQLPPVPQNAQAFDRYAYSLNNPVKYTDPSGHCIWDLCIIEISFVEIIILTGSTFLALEATQPGNPEAFAQTLYDLGEHASQGLQALFAKGEYVPRGLSTDERHAYHDAVHVYKDAYHLGATDKVPKWILDEIAELIKKGVKPEDIPYEAPQPPEEDDEDGGDD